MQSGDLRVHQKLAILKAWLLPYTSKFSGFLCLSIILAFIYRPALHGEFFFDDMPYLIENPQFHLADTLKQIWFTFNFPDYWPISYTLFLAEIKIFGINDPFFYHAVNLLLHILNCFVFWRILVAIRWQHAFSAALLFAVHPLATEAVAWIFQTRTTLSTLWALLAVAFALAYERLLTTNHTPGSAKDSPDSSSKLTGFLQKNPQHSRDSMSLYVASWFAFVLSLLTKPAAAPLPIFLFITGIFFGRLTLKAYAWRLLPFLVAAIASASLTYVHQNTGRSPLAIELNMVEKLILAWDIYLFYVSKMLLPINLRLMYPRMESNLTLSIVSATVGIFLVAILYRGVLTKKSHTARFWLWSTLGTLVLLSPALGFFRSAYNDLADVADRYTYLVLPIAALMIIRALTALTQYWPKRGLYSCLVLLLLTSLSYATWNYAHHFQTAIGAWNFILEHRPDSAIAWYSRGRLRVENQDYDGAIQDLQRALSLKPNYQQAILTLAIIHATRGHMDQAMPMFLKSYELAPNSTHARSNLLAAWQRWIQLAFERGGIAGALAASQEGLAWAKKVGFDQLVSDLEAKALSLSAISNKMPENPN